MRKRLRWLVRLMARPWARWLRPAITGVMIVVALTIAGQAVLADIALPHLIRLDLRPCGDLSRRPV
jgi:hypothetical protein